MHTRRFRIQHHVQMYNDTEYALELNGTKETIGVNLDKSVSSVVKCFNVDLGKHDFVDISLMFDAKVNNEPVKISYKHIYFLFAQYRLFTIKLCFSMTS